MIKFGESQITACNVPTLTIFCPEIYRRRDFREWLDHEDTTVYTLHQKGSPLTQFADIAVMYECADSSPDDDMPEDIWEALCAAWRSKYDEDTPGIIFLRNYARPLNTK